jgi:hypothetical protein
LNDFGSGDCCGTATVGITNVGSGSDGTYCCSTYGCGTYGCGGGDDRNGRWFRVVTAVDGIVVRPFLNWAGSDSDSESFIGAAVVAVVEMAAGRPNVDGGASSFGRATMANSGGTDCVRLSTMTCR